VKVTWIVIERRTFTDLLRGPLPRARIRLDVDGWPYAQGRYGRIEWRGPEATGERRLYAFTDRATPGLHAK
jgi:hypothetical protein